MLGQVEQAGNLTSDILSLGKNLENTTHVPPPISPQTWTDSKQRQREALKKLAQGHKLQSEQEQEFTQSMQMQKGENMRSNPNNPIPNFIVSGYEITLGFDHTKQPNQIASTVEQMLREIGLPKYTPPAENEAKKA